MLTVYKASAGSGKTFQLVAEYLKLLIVNPYNYRHILAVTFTNKATTEMKSRILEQLSLLAGNDKSPYVPLLMTELTLNESQLRKGAGIALKNILHDYSRFSISTIDSFTQRVIKAFNREMGISPHFVLELDNDLILDEAVDRLLSKVDSDEQLKKWLVEFSREKIMENQSQLIENDIKGLGKELFREKFQVFFPDREESVYTRENLNDFRAGLEKIIAVFENTLKSKAKECMDLIESNGFSVEDFSYKMAGVAGYLKNLAAGDIREPLVRVMGAAESSEKWYAKNHPKKQQLGKLVENFLLDVLNDILSFYQKNQIEYYSALEVKKHLRILGILTDLMVEIKQLLLEKGILQLSDSNLLLSKIIDDSDTPFIYEKIGNRFDYYMLDEFQDTSMLQWKNFKPLVSNALSQGNRVLLVGDVKQSIYRWRNSDWNILASQINNDFPQHPPETISLEKNWRSRKNIIDFNNAVLKALIQTYQENLFEEYDNPQYLRKFMNVYQEFLQEPGDPNAEQEGCIDIRFLEDEEFNQNSAGLLVEQVKKLQDKGLGASDIAILIRKKEEGSVIVEEFMNAAKQENNSKYNLTVLSNESLFLYASRGVNFVILVIELLSEPEGKIQKTALLHLWLSWLKPLQEDCHFSLNVGKGIEPDVEASFEPDSELLFDIELGGKIQEIRENVKLASLDEAVMRICRLFGLFDIQSELPFLQTLVDQAAEIKLSLSNDLSNFLHWWKIKGCNTSVNVNEDIDSIRLLTIHKSKGLEYEAVLIPFFTFDSSWPANLPPILWCAPSAKPFSRFPLLPIKASTQLARTIFRNDYFEEKVSYLIDTLNLIYVAFTRARSALVIHCNQPAERKDNGQGKRVNALLHTALGKMASEVPFSGCWKKDDNAFIFGRLPQYTPAEKKGEQRFIEGYAFNDVDERIRLRLNSEEFIIADGQNQSAKNMGRLVHEILSSVKVADDVEMACNKYLAAGLMNSSERHKIIEIFRNSLKHPEIKRWFDGSFTILNERNILTPTQVLRPDRVMVSGKHAIVADYKWGQVKQDDYHAQVSRYAGILKQSGFERVEGYLWYINLDEVEKVCGLI